MYLLQIYLACWCFAPDLACQAQGWVLPTLHTGEQWDGIFVGQSQATPLTAHELTRVRSVFKIPSFQCRYLGSTPFHLASLHQSQHGSKSLLDNLRTPQGPCRHRRKQAPSIMAVYWFSQKLDTGNLRTQDMLRGRIRTTFRHPKL